jgi:hypothetical protein
MRVRRDMTDQGHEKGAKIFIIHVKWDRRQIAEDI